MRLNRRQLRNLLLHEVKDLYEKKGSSSPVKPSKMKNVGKNYKNIKFTTILNAMSPKGQKNMTDNILANKYSDIKVTGNFIVEKFSDFSTSSEQIELCKDYNFKPVKKQFRFTSTIDGEKYLVIIEKVVVWFCKACMCLV